MLDSMGRRVFIGEAQDSSSKEVGPVDHPNLDAYETAYGAWLKSEFKPLTGGWHY